MENLLLTTVNWVGHSLRELRGQGNPVSQVDGVSDITLLVSSMVLPAFLSGRKLSLSSRLDARNFIPPCMPLVPSKLLPWYWSSEGVSLNKFMWRFSKLSMSFFHNSIPVGFCSQKLWGLIFWHWSPGQWVLIWVGLGLLTPEISLPNFLSNTHGCGTSLFCVSPPPTSLIHVAFFFL